MLEISILNEFKNQSKAVNTEFFSQINISNLNILTAYANMAGYSKISCFLFLIVNDCNDLGITMMKEYGLILILFQPNIYFLK